ncbi:MAG: hypothetical protein ACXAC7_09055 [Candidatus Hodarchaeales archaeon]
MKFKTEYIRLSFDHVNIECGGSMWLVSISRGSDDENVLSR